ncbi:hypothetical protein MLD38_017449 [Melastoma candidum]|uniref:Uncharacterized protein n=1 Tax=Melastoma candidum TaxID=119954 RepID=A0ACB9QQR4_9MYRT|nr:hypothetical protein MLD38_017449 [Melastoma candidum]
MAFFVNLVVLFLLSCLVQALYVLWFRRVWIRWIMARQGIRGPPPHFLYGNNRQIARLNKEASDKPMSNLSHDILPRVLPHVATWTKAYGKNFLNWIGTDAQLVITEPELIKEVLNNKEKVFLKDAAHGFLKKILGDGLILSEGDKWANMRKLANHAFHGESLKGMVPAMVDSTRITLERWKDCEGKEIDMSKEFTTLTSEAITRTAFGSSYTEGKRIFDMLRRLAYLASKNVLDKGIPGIRGIWKTADEAEGDRLEKGLHDAFLELMEKREAEVKAGEIDGFGNDFLGMLMQTLHGTGDLKRISANDVIDECKTFYGAGHGTTATLLAWTTFLLAAHPECQEAARKEALEVFGNKDPSTDGLPQLRTMNMIINESLRLPAKVICSSTPICSAMGIHLLFIYPLIPVVLVLGLLKAGATVIDRLWWSPLRVQGKMALQGVRGPPYRFLHGNTREINRMNEEARVPFHSEAKLVISDPDFVREILINREGVFSKPEGSSFIKKLLGSGLPNAQGENWEKQRKLASYAFHGDSLKVTFPSILECIKMMLEDWKNKHDDGKEIKLFQEFKLMTSEVISRAAFGNNYVDGTAIFQMLSELAMFSSKNFHRIRIPGFGKIWHSADEIEGQETRRTYTECYYIPR